MPGCAGPLPQCQNLDDASGLARRAGFQEARSLIVRLRRCGTNDFLHRPARQGHDLGGAKTFSSPSKTVITKRSSPSTALRRALSRFSTRRGLFAAALHSTMFWGSVLCVLRRMSVCRGKAWACGFSCRPHGVACSPHEKRAACGLSSMQRILVRPNGLRLMVQFHKTTGQ